MEEKKPHIALVVLTNMCRFLLAALFVFSGFVKAVDPMGSFYKIQDYLVAFDILQWFPDILILLMSIALASVEFILGALMLMGIRKGLVSYLILMFMLVMTPLTLYLAIANPVSDCGCFGDAWVLTNWQTFTKNLVLLAAAFCAVRWNQLIIRFISIKLGWLFGIYLSMFVVVLSFYCLYHLPIVDFRPYKIGTNIPEGMAFPEDGDIDAMPAINDFWMMDVEQGEELTEQILNDSSYTFLLVAHHIEAADDSDIDLINELYEYAHEYGYPFYALTASSEEDIEYWSDRTGAEYPFLQMDDITLKTIIRSNPGVVLLKEGTIYNKWGNNDLPDEYQLTGPLEEIEVGELNTESAWRRLGSVLLWSIGPMLLLLLLDKLFWKRNALEILTEKKEENEETL